MSNTHGAHDMNYNYYSDKLYIGLSASQLFFSKVNFNSNTADNKLNAHYNLTAAYRIALDDEFDIVPSTLLKYTAKSLAADLGVKVRYRSNFYAGVAYRLANAKVENTSDALTGLVGLTINKTLDIGYAYDFTTSALKAGSTGTHEVTLGVRLFNKKTPAPKLW
jgi:type IX secretion system PorP/SprF family membrane protein